MSDQPRYKISQAIVDGLNKKQSVTPTAIDQLMYRMKSICDSTIRDITPVLKAGGGFDTQALREMVFKILAERLDNLSKDEMHSLLTILLADRLLTEIDKNPRGNDTPDLLS